MVGLERLSSPGIELAFEADAFQMVVMEHSDSRVRARKCRVQNG